MDHFKHNYRHWGICDDHCEDYLERTDGGRNVESVYNQKGGMYTETNLDIAAQYECKEKHSEIKPSEEFCAGGRIQINVDVYKVDSNVTSNSSDVYRMSHRVLNQGSFGVIDACQGDSGGPIWRTVKNPITGIFQAVIVGVVKVGRGKS